MNTLTKGFAIAGMIALTILIVFISPMVAFWLSYFCGWIAKITIGKYIVEGFALFGVTMPIDKIPLCAGILGFIGQFFKKIKLEVSKNF